MAKEKRDIRINQAYSFYQTVNAPGNLMSQADAKLNLTTLGTKFTEGELTKWLEKHPDVNATAFIAFCSECGVTGKSKSHKEGGTGQATRLNTAGKAKECGVADENIPAFITAVEAVYAQKKVLEAIINSELSVSFSIPTGRNKKETEPEVAPKTVQS